MIGLCIKIYLALQPRPIRILCKSVRSIKVQVVLYSCLTVNAMHIYLLYACFNFCGAVV